MQKSTIPNTQSKRLGGWGASLLNKMTAVARNRVKREVSKHRRVALKKEQQSQQ